MDPNFDISTLRRRIGERKREGKGVREKGREGGSERGRERNGGKEGEKGREEKEKGRRERGRERVGMRGRVRASLDLCASSLSTIYPTAKHQQVKNIPVLLPSKSPFFHHLEVMTFSCHCFVPHPTPPHPMLWSLSPFLIILGHHRLFKLVCLFLPIFYHTGRGIFLKFKASYTTFLLKILQFFPLTLG